MVTLRTLHRCGGGMLGTSNSPYIRKQEKTMIDKTFLKTSTLALAMAFAVSPLALAADRM
jgi:hypothetical protein